MGAVAVGARYPHSQKPPNGLHGLLMRNEGGPDLGPFALGKGGNGHFDLDQTAGGGVALHLWIVPQVGFPRLHRIAPERPPNEGAVLVGGYSVAAKTAGLRRGFHFQGLQWLGGCAGLTLVLRV